MSKYAMLIRELLDKQYPSQEQTKTLSINSISCQFMSTLTQKYLQSYTNVKIMIFTHCDLRNLQNFPQFPQITDLDLSNNSLQGTFNFLMKLSTLQYLNISNNLVSDVNKLQPLRKINDLSIYVKNNPFTNKDGFKNKIKSFNLQLLRDPKKLTQKSAENVNSNKLKLEVSSKEKEETRKQEIRNQQLRRQQSRKEALKQVERERERIEMRQRQIQRQHERRRAIVQRNYGRVRGDTNQQLNLNEPGNIYFPSSSTFRYRMPSMNIGLNRIIGRDVGRDMTRLTDSIDRERANSGHFLREMHPAVVRRGRPPNTIAQTNMLGLIKNESNLSSQRIENQANSCSYSSDSRSEEEEKNEEQDDQNMSSDQDEQLEQESEEDEELNNEMALDDENLRLLSEEEDQLDEMGGLDYHMFMNDALPNSNSFIQSEESPSEENEE